jgi:hypothetical protein
MDADRFDDDRALAAALAEFTALRSLITTRVQLQIAWLSAGFTAIGIIAGVALGKGGDPKLELLVPILASVVSVVYSELRVRIGLSGSYIRDALWPYIISITDSGLRSWEHYSADNSNVLQLGISGAQAPGFLLLASVLALVARFHALDGSSGFVLLWVVGATLTGISGIYAFSVGLHELRDNRERMRGRNVTTA